MLALFSMSTTLTIRNLDASVKQKLRLKAASHQTSMEAEARAILARSLTGDDGTDQATSIAERRKRVAASLGIWQDRYQGKATDEVMAELRGNE
jgi:plasmid stability protein